MKTTPRSAPALSGSVRKPPDMSAWPRGSSIIARRNSSASCCSHARFCRIVRPSILGRPPVTIRNGSPQVCISTVVMNRVGLTSRTGPVGSATWRRRAASRYDRCAGRAGARRPRARGSTAPPARTTDRRRRSQAPPEPTAGDRSVQSTNASPTAVAEQQMSIGRLQTIIDGIAAALSCQVVLDDERQRLLAHSDHDMTADDVRVASILARGATPEIRAWFEQWGILTATEPVRTPADRERLIAPRWVVPLRHERTLLGFVSVLDRGRLTREQLAPLLESTAVIAETLYVARRAEPRVSALLQLLVLPR